MPHSLLPTDSTARRVDAVVAVLRAKSRLSMCGYSAAATADSAQSGARRCVVRC